MTDAPRPVPLSYDYTLETLEATVELGLRAGEAPLYIVHFSQDEALKHRPVAGQLRRIGERPA